MRDKIAKIIVDAPSEGAAADAIIEALPGMIPDLVWDDFEGRGAKATAFERANYLITKWSTEKFELSLSYPGYSTGCGKIPHQPTLEAAKAVANKHHRARIMQAFGLGDA